MGYGRGRQLRADGGAHGDEHVDEQDDGEHQVEADEEGRRHRVLGEGEALDERVGAEQLLHQQHRRLAEARAHARVDARAIVLGHGARCAIPAPPAVSAAPVSML